MNPEQMRQKKLHTHDLSVVPAAGWAPSPPRRDVDKAGSMDFVLKPRERLPGMSIVIPCYNEAENLNRLLPRLQGVLQSLISDWEVILVDDGSRDNTSEVLAFWSTQPGFQAIQLSRNFGKEAALTAGLDAARCETCVMMDADLQHSPDLIPAMLAQWQLGYDVVYAVREHRRDEETDVEQGNALRQRLQRFVERHAEILMVVQDAELGTHGIADLLRDRGQSRGKGVAGAE